MRIRTKLTISFLLLTIIPMFFIASLCYYSAKESLQEEIIDELKLTASIRADKVVNIEHVLTHIPGAKCNHK